MKLQGEKNDLFKPKEFEEIKKQFELLSGQEINQLITNYENKGWINGYNDGEATMLFCLSKLDDETIIKEINEIRKAKDSSTLQSFATKLTIMANKSMERWYNNWRNWWLILKENEEYVMKLQGKSDEDLIKLNLSEKEAKSLTQKLMFNAQYFEELALIVECLKNNQDPDEEYGLCVFNQKGVDKIKEHLDNYDLQIIREMAEGSYNTANKAIMLYGNEEEKKSLQDHLTKMKMIDEYEKENDPVKKEKLLKELNEFVKIKK